MDFRKAVPTITFAAASLALMAFGGGVASAAPVAHDGPAWSSEPKIECVQQNWGTIKSTYDPMLGQLSNDDRAALGDLIGPDGKFVDSPSPSSVASTLNTVPDAALDQMLSGIC